MLIGCRVRGGSSRLFSSVSLDLSRWLSLLVGIILMRDQNRINFCCSSNLVRNAERSSSAESAGEGRGDAGGGGWESLQDRIPTTTTIRQLKYSWQAGKQRGKKGVGGQIITGSE